MLAMLEQAKARDSKFSLGNVEWKLGAAEELPLPEDSFSAVLTRYSFHHLAHPAKTLREMLRICTPRGRLIVCDVTPDSDKPAAYDEIELLRGLRIHILCPWMN